jgi:hypothetical protein
LDDTEDISEEPHHGNGVESLPLLTDLLNSHAIPVPDWIKKSPPLNMEVFDQFLSSRVVFYPGSGMDMQPVELFNGTHNACCFVYADFEPISNFPQFRGYETTCVQTLTAEELQKCCQLNAAHPFNRDPELNGAVWTVLHWRPGYAEEPGSEWIAFLHIRAEAVWIYWNLWGQNSRYLPYAVILQDHGIVGHCWTKFGDYWSPLRTMTVNVPPWLLVAENTWPWPGYVAKSNWTREAGMGRHRRALYAMAPRQEEIPAQFSERCANLLNVPGGLHREVTLQQVEEAVREMFPQGLPADDDRVIHELRKYFRHE